MNAITLPLIVQTCPACRLPVGIGVARRGASCRCYPLQSGDFDPEILPSETDSAIMSDILEREATPGAIIRFARTCSGLTDSAYWYALGALWVSYTGWSSLYLWRRLLRSKRPNCEKYIMRPSELAALRMLPHRVTAYRAHRELETDWISYTLDPYAAAEFAHRRGSPCIAEYSVRTRDVVALFLRRGEDEILMLDPLRATRVRTIPVVVSTDLGSLI